jgi:hypothetical protein
MPGEIGEEITVTETGAVVTTLQVLCYLIDKIGAAPIVAILMILFFGPWAFSFLMTRDLERRFGEMKKMYTSNVKLVEDYAEVATDLRNIIVMNTQVMTTISEEIRQNQYCPMVRIKKERVTQRESTEEIR